MASWHPERAEKALGEGDFWVYRRGLGACVGGRNMEVKEDTRKSKNPFLRRVHQSYHIASKPVACFSHELEYPTIVSLCLIFSEFLEGENFDLG